MLPVTPEFPSATLIASFKGGAVYTAERDGKYLVALLDLLDLLDAQEQEGIFPTRTARKECICRRGWWRSEDSDS